MPVISTFYGIIISMFFEQTGKHHTPHFHASYGEYDAEINFEGDIISGALPKNQAAYVKAWALIHSDELAANWKLAMTNEKPYKIDPLK